MWLRRGLAAPQREVLSRRAVLLLATPSALAEIGRGTASRALHVAESVPALSTLIDAFHRNHKVTYLCDASASHALEDVSADEIHRAVSKISGLYGDVFETDDWIASTLPRKLGIGKNAGG